MEPPQPNRPGRASAPAPHAPSGAHGAAQGAAGAPGAHEAHPSRAMTYLGIFAVLFVVTGLEVAVTYFPDIPQAPSLLTMAAIKFVLIAAFYMHLKYDSRVFSAFFIIGLILAAGMLFSFLALFTAHYREPFVPEEAAQTATTTGTPAPGAATATPTR
jgi:cytochrome c oxidase subunit 4